MGKNCLMGIPFAFSHHTLMCMHVIVKVIIQSQQFGKTTRREQNSSDSVQRNNEETGHLLDIWEQIQVKQSL